MDHQHLTEESEIITENVNEAKISETPENNEVETSVHEDKRLWVKPVDKLFIDKIKEEVSDCEYQTFVDVKDEIEEVEEKVEELPTKQIVKFELISKQGPPPLVDIRMPKVVIPKVHKTAPNKKVKLPKGRKCRKPRAILPMTQPIASASTSHLEQTPTSHQIIMPSSQMPGIAYQIILGDHNTNSNTPVQYTMLQHQPVFLQQTPTSVSTPSPVVISQPSMVINQSYQMSQTQVQPSAKVSKITTRSRSSCLFCYKLFNNVNEHIKECWLNPDSTRYKFRKIAPSTSL